MHISYAAKKSVVFFGPRLSITETFIQITSTSLPFEGWSDTRNSLTWSPGTAWSRFGVSGILIQLRILQPLNGMEPTCRRYRGGDSGDSAVTVCFGGSSVIARVLKRWIGVEL